MEPPKVEASEVCSKAEKPECAGIGSLPLKRTKVHVTLPSDGPQASCVMCSGRSRVARSILCPGAACCKVHRSAPPTKQLLTSAPLPLPLRAELSREFDPGPQVSSTCRRMLRFTRQLSSPTP